MTETSAQSAAGRWRTTLAKINAALAWVRTRLAGALQAALVWFVKALSSPKFDLFMLALQLVTLAALLTMAYRQSGPAPEPAPAATAPDLHSLESRLGALEGMVSALHADLQQLGVPPALVPRPASTRAAPAPAAATTTLSTFGVTDLDRRLAAFQARLDAAPSLTTTNPETAP